MCDGLVYIDNVAGDDIGVWDAGMLKMISSYLYEQIRRRIEADCITNNQEGGWRRETREQPKQKQILLRIYEHKNANVAPNRRLLYPNRGGESWYNWRIYMTALPKYVVAYNLAYYEMNKEKSYSLFGTYAKRERGNRRGPVTFLQPSESDDETLQSILQSWHWKLTEQELKKLKSKNQLDYIKGISLSWWILIQSRILSFLRNSACIRNSKRKTFHPQNQLRLSFLKNIHTVWESYWARAYSQSKSICCNVVVYGEHTWKEI